MESLRQDLKRKNSTKSIVSVFFPWKVVLPVLPKWSDITVKSWPIKFSTGTVCFGVKIQLAFFWNSRDLSLFFSAFHLKVATNIQKINHTHSLIKREVLILTVYPFSNQRSKSQVHTYWNTLFLIPINGSIFGGQFLTFLNKNLWSFWSKNASENIFWCKNRSLGATYNMSIKKKDSVSILSVWNNLMWNTQFDANRTSYGQRTNLLTGFSSWLVEQK